MLGSLAHAEFAVEKSEQVHNMNIKEQKNYEKLNKEIGKCVGGDSFTGVVLKCFQFFHQSLAFGIKITQE